MPAPPPDNLPFDNAASPPSSGEDVSRPSTDQGLVPPGQGFQGLNNQMGVAPPGVPPNQLGGPPPSSLGSPGSGQPPAETTPVGDRTGVSPSVPQQPSLAQPLHPVGRPRPQQSQAVPPQPRGDIPAGPAPTPMMPTSEPTPEKQTSDFQRRPPMPQSVPPAQEVEAKKEPEPYIKEKSSQEQIIRVMPTEFRGQKGTRGLEVSPPPSSPKPSATKVALPAQRPASKNGPASKKIAILFIALLLIGGGVYIYFNYFYVPGAPPPWESPKGFPSLDTAPTPSPDASDTSAEDTSPDDTSMIIGIDVDADGLLDEQEIELGTNPEDADSDRDGIPDGWEVNNFLDPLDPSDNDQDPDADNLDNTEEYQYKCDPHNSDTDGDSFPDGQEVENGYDPTSSEAIRLELPREEEEQEGQENEEETGCPQCGESSLGTATASAPDRDRKRKADVKALELALELYYDDHGFFPQDLESLSPDWVVRLPKDPAYPNYEYRYVLVSPNTYELAANLEADNDPDDLVDGVEDQIYRVKVVQQ